MSQQILEQSNIDKSTTVDIYREAETAIRQLERFEKTCPTWEKTTTPKSTRLVVE